MKRIVLCAFAALLVGLAVEVRAADIVGQVTVTMNPTKTSMDVPALTGGKVFENSGYYYEAIADLRMQKFAFYGAYQTGRSNSIEGGTDFTSPNFNFLSGEQTNITDLNLAYQIVDTRYTGKLDLGVGYLHIFDDAEISPSTTYEGTSISLHGKAMATKKLALDYRFAYVPNFSVAGNAAVNFSSNYIYRYRIAAEYPLWNSLGITAGYQDITILLKVKFDQSRAAVHARGGFGGLYYRF